MAGRCSIFMADCYILRFPWGTTIMWYPIGILKKVVMALVTGVKGREELRKNKCHRGQNVDSLCDSQVISDASL